MRLILLAALALLLSSSAASAICIGYPDDASTGYTDNTTNHVLCLQQELAEDTDRAAQKAHIESQLQNLQVEIERQQNEINARLADPNWLKNQFP
jgi:hypothetical protein